MTGPPVGVVTIEGPSRPNADEATADAVARADGRPWLVSPREQDISAVLSRAGALVFPDGPELAPEDVGTSPELRFQVGLMRSALDVDMPVYAIGRGFQVLNIAQGGSIAEMRDGHLPIVEESEPGEEQSNFHRIYISPGSKLAAVVGSGGLVRVNSRHRYGIREAQKAGRLMASAYCLDDGVIEALESPGHRWVIGVQFRPELRLEIPPHFDRLMRSLVERAKERLHATNSP